MGEWEERKGQEGPTSSENPKTHQKAPLAAGKMFQKRNKGRVSSQIPKQSTEGSSAHCPAVAPALPSPPPTLLGHNLLGEKIHFFAATVKITIPNTLLSSEFFFNLQTKWEVFGGDLKFVFNNLLGPCLQHYEGTGQQALAVRSQLFNDLEDLLQQLYNE